MTGRGDGAENQRVREDWPTTVEPNSRAHRERSPVRRFIALRLHALSSWPMKVARQGGQQDLRHQAERGGKHSWCS